MDPKAHRETTFRIHVGPVPIGGGAPVAVQSMTNTDTSNVGATLEQIAQLAEAGCEIIRVAVPDEKAASALRGIVRESPLPVIADIHFDYRLALASLDAGVHGLRINPGTLRGAKALDRVAEAARAHGVPIRVGVNAGSLPKGLLRQYGGPSPEAMVEAALGYIRRLEEMGFRQIKISLKSSSVLHTIRAYELLSRRARYPLHLGVTEAGTLISGTVKSALGIGALLMKGIGDTFRVSLTRHPVEEVQVAYAILRSVELRRRGPEIISCPTCGRCEIDLFSLVERVEKALASITPSPKVAIMGCVVNGPGEAREADIGIAGGRGQGLLFKRGKVVRKVPEEEMADVLIREVLAMVSDS